LPESPYPGHNTEEELRPNEKRLQTLLDLNLMTKGSESDLTHFAMESAVQLTNSSIGYIAFVNEDETLLTMYAWSIEAMRECAIENKPIAYKVCDTGLWGEAIRQRRVVITNDYAARNPLKKGTPEGHVKITRHMNIPVFEDNRIVIVAGVGNKLTEYGEDDIHQLTLLMSGLWTILCRKRAEAEKEKLQAQLLQAQKMEAIGKLAGGIAHDFNNMLGVILGHVELALKKMEEDNSLHKTLNKIQEAALRSADLTRQLLAFARKQTISPRVLNLNDTVQGMLNLLLRVIGEDIDLAWEPGRNLSPVKMDPTQIDQILANLCVNARDAISGVGKITIETDHTVFDDAYCAGHIGFLPGEYVMLAVSDNGCGMNSETLSHLFEPFYTTKKLGKGTGLGLATVYGIVKQNNGFINVYSESGQGTTFKIYLPRHAAHMDQEPQIPRPQALARGCETILLVEDEPMILEMTTTMLEELGYRVLPAPSPGESIRLAKEHPDQIHLLMTDVVMPEMNGRDLSMYLIKLYPDLKHLFMSGYTANVIAHQGVLDKGVAFIQKPFSLKDLAGMIRKVLDTKEYTTAASGVTEANDNMGQILGATKDKGHSPG